MSRLIVKNLPKSVTEAKLKELFSEKGNVTDVQLKYTKDGKFRRFCFIGYKTEEQAESAREHFNHTCIDTARITVEQCASLGDPSKPKSWSKYALDSTAHKQLVDKAEGKTEKKKTTKNVEEDSKKETKKKKDKKEISKEVKEALEKHKDDPLFAEFLESHSGVKAAWSNDTAIIPGDLEKHDGDADSKEFTENENESNEEEEEESKEKPANKVISDLEYMESLKKKEEKKDAEKTDSTKSVSKHGPQKFFTVKIHGLAYKHKKKDIKQLFRPLKAKSIRVPRGIGGIAYVGFKTEQQLKKALLKHKSFLDGKQISVTRYEQKENNEASKNEETNNPNVRWKKQEEALKEEESIAESGRMFVRNLAYTTTEDDIRKLFEKYGPLTEVNVPVDRVTRKPKGFGTITFLMPEHALKCYMELDGTILNGRMLHLLPGKSKSSAINTLENENLTYKQKKELKTKATANSTHNWNALFLGQNAVAEAVATAYNTTKEKVLEDASKGMSAAVKLALGETQLVQDTKKFLEENGVCLDAFNQPPEKRSKTVLLVKNLPAGTTANEIRRMFAQHGELGRVVMPQSGITALVEYLEPSEARIGFGKLAYTKFKHLPLYLEWAPDNSFTTPPTNAKNSASDKSTQKVVEDSAVSKENSNKVEEEKKEKAMEVPSSNNVNQEESEDEDEPEPDTTIFLKNINFSTTDDELKEYFGKCGPIHYASIAMKKDPKNPGGKLSMGYGFVRYKRKADADRALRTLQMTVLKDKSLELKRSERTLETEVKTAKKTSKPTTPTGSKILVRNVPFQATTEEITELFKAFGELKAVRLPKKLVGAEKHRGFAFVEYYTKSEAKRAFKALCQSTHLYGRRLVLEWAQTEEGIDEIRKRTAKHFYHEDSAKRSKKSTLDPETIGLAEGEEK